MSSTALTLAEQRMISMERQWARLPFAPPLFQPGVNERYQELIAATIDKGAAMDYDPIITTSLRRQHHRFITASLLTKVVDLGRRQGGEHKRGNPTPKIA